MPDIFPDIRCEKVSDTSPMDIVYFWRAGSRYLAIVAVFDENDNKKVLVTLESGESRNDNCCYVININNDSHVFKINGKIIIEYSSSKDDGLTSDRSGNYFQPTGDIIIGEGGSYMFVALGNSVDPRDYFIVLETVGYILIRLVIMWRW